jgi:cysteine rich repeat protein
MSEQTLSHRMLAGGLTFMVLGLIWVAIVTSLPSEQELAAKEAPILLRTVSKSLPEPTLDLSIPGVPSTQPAPRTTVSAERPFSSKSLDPRAAQIARLRCEAEVEQLCPESLDGTGRKQCLEQRTPQLAVSCQHQVRQRLVKWKEERSRLTAACQVDIKRFCPMKPGSGELLQCLQQHAQELSDGCYERLPKGVLHLKY